MKITPNKKIFFFLLVIFSFFPGIILADDQPQQKETIQKVEQEKIDQPIKDDRDRHSGQVKTETKTFDWGPLINFFGILLSASVIIWQIGRQHKNNYDLQQKNNREKLKLEIYKEFRKKISVAANKIIITSTNANMLIAHFNMFERHHSTKHSTGIKPLQLNEREPAFREMHFSALGAIADLISFIEEYEIINPNLEIFRTAFSYTSHCMTETYNPFHLILLEFLPHDVPLKDQSRAGTNIIIPKAPSKDDLERIKKTATPYMEAAMEAGCYVSDLSKEAQNICIGSLFSNHLPPREPIDKRHIVISTDPQKVAELKKYFFEETGWGKNATKMNEKILKEIRK